MLTTTSLFNINNVLPISKMKIREKIIQEENDIKPNRTSAMIALVTLFVTILILVLNFTGVFHVEKLRMTISCSFLALCAVVIHILGMSKRTNYLPWTKWVIVVLIYLQVLCSSVLLAQWSELLIAFPLFLTMQYHNKKITWISFGVTLLIAFFSGIIALALGFLQYDYYTFLLRAIGYEVPNPLPLNPDYKLSDYIVLFIRYLSLPRLLICVTWGLLGIATTKLVDSNLNSRIVASHYMSTDILTGLPNRYAYEKYIDELKNDPNQKDILIVYFDVDGLHALNNKKGHHAGDEMLKFFAEQISACFGETSYRLGGDEFVSIVLDKMDVQQIEEIVKRINSQSNEPDYHISVGIAKASTNEEIDKAYKEAERLMYLNKRRYYVESGKEQRKY